MINLNKKQKQITLDDAIGKPLTQQCPMCLKKFQYWKYEKGNYVCPKCGFIEADQQYDFF